MTPIPFVNFKAQFESERDVVHDTVERVFASGDFVGGGVIEELERSLSLFCGVRHAVALNSGTDALILSMRALGIGPGDEVITPPNSFLASTGAIVAVGATPVFADVCDDQNIDPAAVAAKITPRTRAIMPVHLTGRIADMDALTALAEQHDLVLVEDAAQAIGSSLAGRMSGSFGGIGCFSTHPLKNLNAAGDGGFITTDRDDVAERVRRLRNHGLVDRDTALEWGTVSRMDCLQAAILLTRLARLPNVISRRRDIARRYGELLAGTPVFVPPFRQSAFDTYHTFVIQAPRRDELSAYLKAQDIYTAIHYPRPIHLQPAARAFGHQEGDFPATERQARVILSLPVHQFLSDSDVDRVGGAIRTFYGLK